MCAYEFAEIFIESVSIHINQPNSLKPVATMLKLLHKLAESKEGLERLSSPQCILKHTEILNQLSKDQPKILKPAVKYFELFCGNVKNLQYTSSYYDAVEKLQDMEEN